jgi:hypothetical protein
VCLLVDTCCVVGRSLIERGPSPVPECSSSPMLRPTALTPVEAICGYYLEEPLESYFGYPHIVAIRVQAEVDRLNNIGHMYLPASKVFQIVAEVPDGFWTQHLDLYRDYPHERVLREMTLSVTEYGISLEKRQYVKDSGTYYPGEDPESWEDAQREEEERIENLPAGSATPEDRTTVQVLKDRLMRSPRKLDRPVTDTVVPATGAARTILQPPRVSLVTLLSADAPRTVSPLPSPIKNSLLRDTRQGTADVGSPVRSTGVSTSAFSATQTQPSGQVIVPTWDAHVRMASPKKSRMRDTPIFEVFDSDTDGEERPVGDGENFVKKMTKMKIKCHRPRTGLIRNPGYNDFIIGRPHTPYVRIKVEPKDQSDWDMVYRDEWTGTRTRNSTRDSPHKSDHGSDYESLDASCPNSLYPPSGSGNPAETIVTQVERDTLKAISEVIFSHDLLSGMQKPRQVNSKTGKFREARGHVAESIKQLEGQLGHYHSLKVSKPYVERLVWPPSMQAVGLGMFQESYSSSPRSGAKRPRMGQSVPNPPYKQFVTPARQDMSRFSLSDMLDTATPSTRRESDAGSTSSRTATTPGTPFTQTVKRGEDGWARMVQGKRLVKPCGLPREKNCTHCWAFGETRPRLELRLHCEGCDSRVNQEQYAKRARDEEYELTIALSKLPTAQQEERFEQLVPSHRERMVERSSANPDL